MKSILLIAALLPLASPAQTASGYPAPPPGAPTTACSLTDLPASTSVRILRGPDPIPYAFACAQHGSDKPCIGGKLDPGLVVNVGPSSGEWSCVTGGDSTSGWVLTSSLAELPATPRVPLQEWIGWWRNGPDTSAGPGDRLLITRGATPGTLHISGRAYWYGLNDSVHIGELAPADAKPSGPYLHVVDGDTLSSCIVDLRYQLATHTLSSYDNTACGGMNVRFSGTWSRFIPASPRRKHRLH